MDTLKQYRGMLGVSVMLAVSGQVLAGERNVVFAGADVAEKSYAVYIGGVSAWNGDLAKNGFLLRAMAIFGEYEYDTTGVATGEVNADQLGLQAGIGYQWITNSARLSLYGSVDYQDHDTDPNDISNSVNGDETGAAVQAEVETMGSPLKFGLIGSYSSTNETYWARGRVGYAFSGFHAGPEVIFGGNQEYDENRYGLYAAWPSGNMGFQVSGGYFDSQGDTSIRNEDGAYGGVGFSLSF